MLPCEVGGHWTSASHDLIGAGEEVGEAVMGLPPHPSKEVGEGGRGSLGIQRWLAFT